MAKERWQLQSLDSLRGIAILGVLAVHSLIWAESHPRQIIYDMLVSGQRGVQLFFVVSAFTLYLSFDNRKQEKHPTRNFFLRRLFRLTPMFYLATLLSFFLWRDALGPPSHIAASMAYVGIFWMNTAQHSAPGAWSIETEAAFYMLLPFAFKYVRTPERAALLVLLCAVIRRAALLLLHPQQFAYTYWTFASLQANAGIFAMGILLYMLWRDYLRKWSEPNGARAWSFALLMLVVSLFIECPPSDQTRLLYGGALAAVLTAALLLHPWKLFVNRATVLLGKISFSLYLLHFYVGREIGKIVTTGRIGTALARSGDLRILLVFVLIILITGPISFVTWRYIEEPCILLGKRLIERLERRRIPGTFAEEQF